MLTSMQLHESIHVTVLRGPDDTMTPGTASSLFTQLLNVSSPYLQVPPDPPGEEEAQTGHFFPLTSKNKRLDGLGYKDANLHFFSLDGWGVAAGRA